VNYSLNLVNSDNIFLHKNQYPTHISQNSTFLFLQSWIVNKKSETYPSGHLTKVTWIYQYELGTQCSYRGSLNSLAQYSCLIKPSLKKGLSWLYKICQSLSASGNYIKQKRRKKIILMKNTIPLALKSQIKSVE